MIGNKGADETTKLSKTSPQTVESETEKPRKIYIYIYIYIYPEEIQKTIAANIRLDEDVFETYSKRF